MHHIQSIIKEGNSLHRKHRIPPSGFRPGRANAAIAIPMLSRSDTCAVSLEYRKRTGLRPSDARAAKPLARRTAPQLRTSLKSHRVRPCSALRAQLDMHDRDRASHDDAEQPHIEWLHCIDDTTEFGWSSQLKWCRAARPTWQLCKRNEMTIVSPLSTRTIQGWKLSANCTQLNAKILVARMAITIEMMQSSQTDLATLQ